MRIAKWWSMSLLACVLAACSRPDPGPGAAPAPAADAPPAGQAEERPPAVTHSQLNPEQVSRLVRTHSPVLGAANAPVTVVEFLDPACEACRAYAPLVKQILFVHPEEVRVVVRYAAFHPGSDEAVRILEAARRQGMLDEVLGALFEQQQDWASHHAPNIENAWKIAASAGLGLARARRDARAPEVDALLKQEADDVIALQVSRTPTFFVNGKLLVDFGPEQLMKLVADEVAAAKPKP
jgi:protein-disulfide isomerase